MTTVPLTTKFLAQLDKYSDDLIKVSRVKGGSAGQKIRTIMALTAKVSIFFCCSFLHVLSFNLIPEFLSVLICVPFSPFLNC